MTESSGRVSAIVSSGSGGLDYVYVGAIVQIVEVALGESNIKNFKHPSSLSLCSSLVTMNLVKNVDCRLCGVWSRYQIGMGAAVHVVAVCLDVTCRTTQHTSARCVDPLYIYVLSSAGSHCAEHGSFDSNVGGSQ